MQTVEAQDIASENTVSGQVTAGSETSVYVTATAKCTAVYVEAGDAVKAGDVICSLDMESSLAQYRAAEIGYTSAASSYSDQKNILDRQVALYEKTGTTPRRFSRSARPPCRRSTRWSCNIFHQGAA